MKFGAVRLKDAEGAILAHSRDLPSGRLRKGLVLGPEDLSRLAEAGIEEVVVARPSPGDIGENEAATRLGAALVSAAEAQRLTLTKAATGRVNLMASGHGILDLNPEAVLALNLCDPMITLATLPLYARVGPRGMVGTVKIIPYAVPERSLLRAVEAAAQSAIMVRAPVWTEATLIETQIGAEAPEKGEAAIRQRLSELGVTLSTVLRVPHESEAIAKAIEAAKGLVLILTASATSDLYDTAPEGVRLAGGTLCRFGMPVDPGNLLFLGEQAGRPVIGLPGCARSSALNGADLVLNRVVCGVPVGAEDIAAMGVGGLLKETKQRGHPRAG